MKKRILVPVILGVMGIGGLTAIAIEEIGYASNEKTLTFEEIEKKVLSEVDGVVTDIDFETIGIKSYYEVEVITGEEEYELKLDAISGELLRKTKEPVDYEDLKQVEQATSQTVTNDNYCDDVRFDDDDDRDDD